MTQDNLKTIFKITSPVFFGYLAIGIPFGLMMFKAGYPFWIMLLMSVLIYAGSGQYMAVGLFAAGAGLTEILIAQFFLNIRHIFYGIPLINRLKSAGKWKPYIIFALTDETYALLSSYQPPKDIKSGTFYGLISLLNQIYWILASVLGALFGAILPFSFEGIDFALTALFTVLLIEQIKRAATFMPVIIGAAAAIFSILFIPSQNMLLASIGISTAVLAGVKNAFHK